MPATYSSSFLVSLPATINVFQRTLSRRNSVHNEPTHTDTHIYSDSCERPCVVLAGEGGRRSASAAWLSVSFPFFWLPC